MYVLVFLLLSGVVSTQQQETPLQQPPWVWYFPQLYANSAGVAVSYARETAGQPLVEAEQPPEDVEEAEAVGEVGLSGYPADYPLPLQPTGGTEFNIRSAQYGKEGINMLYVAQDGPVYSIKELECNTELFLRSNKEYRYGDNSDVVSSTSTIQAIQTIAKKNGIENIEMFGIQLTSFLINRFPQFVRVRIQMTERPWEEIQDSQGQKHNHAFIEVPSSIRNAEVEVDRSGVARVSAGIRGLKMLKTTKAGFVNFISDELRLTPDKEDRRFSVVVNADWTYNNASGLNFDDAYRKIHDIIVEQFAGPVETGVHSYSTQYTQHQMQKAVLEEFPQIETVTIEMLNRLYDNVDFSKFPTVVQGKGAGQVLIAKTPSKAKSTLDRKDLDI